MGNICLGIKVNENQENQENPNFFLDRKSSDASHVNLPRKVSLIPHQIYIGFEKFDGYQVSVGKILPGDKLYSSEEIELEKIFKIINKGTLSQPYSNQKDYMMIMKKERIYRYNHNGVHSARVTRNCEMILCLLNEHGLLNYEINEKEWLKIILVAAYCQRSGRVSEYEKGSSFIGYFKRSALVFEFYARQFKFDSGKIALLKRVLRRLHSKNEDGLYFQFEEGGLYFQLKRILNLSHRLDLYRCYSKKKFKENELIDDIKVLFASQIVNEMEKIENAKEILKQFRKFSLNLIKLTGVNAMYSRGMYNQNEEADMFNNFNDRFRKFSKNGELCWSAVQSQKIPTIKIKTRTIISPNKL